MIELVTTDGVFRLDGGEWEVTNNVWLVGDDREVIVIDAAHDHRPIVDALHGRKVAAIALTHGHNDHINAAAALREAVDAPILLHPADHMLWRDVYPDLEPDGTLADRAVLRAGGEELGVIHTPGHSPGGCCFHAGAVVFSGDTLFCGGPGATGRSWSDLDTILASIRARLLTLPPETIVHTGHGESTTIARRGREPRGERVESSGSRASRGVSRAMYAVIRTGGKQYKVESGQQLEVERIGAETDAVVELTPVLVVDGATVLATPAQLSGATVKAKVLGDARGPKINAFTYKPKSNQRRHWGHRQHLSLVEITDITVGAAKSRSRSKKAAAADEAAAPAEES